MLQVSWLFVPHYFSRGLEVRKPPREIEGITEKLEALALWLGWSIVL